MIDDRCNLKGTGVLVTRPTKQAESLCRIIEERGGTALRFPAIEIGPPSDPGDVRADLEDIADYDILIFISANAVIMGLHFLPDNRLPSSAMIAAIGRATARTLAEYGYPLAIVPEHDFDSEGLLETSELQDVRGKRILIFRGEGGRPMLGDSLRDRGAEVEYAEVYRRYCPEFDGKAAQLPWISDLSLVTATSIEIIDNLMRLFGEGGRELLLAHPLLVVSERMREYARSRGFRQLLLADGPDDESILETICRWVAYR